MKINHLKWTAIRITLVITSTFLSILLVEGLLQLFSKTYLSNKKDSEVNDFSYSEYILKKTKDQHIQDNTFNIYYFGESTMEGVPFENIIPTLVEKNLNSHVQKNELRWINMARAGINFSEISNRIHILVSHPEIFHPSLVVIYSGHNEFLHYHDGVGFAIVKKYPWFINTIISKSQIVSLLARVFKIYKLEIDDRSFFDEPLFPVERYTEVIDNYTHEYSDALALLKQNHIPVIVSTQVANYTDFEPNRSVFCENNSNKTAFFKNMQDGMQYLNKNIPTEALFSYNKAIDLCGTFAETYYRLGKTYQSMRQIENAKFMYRKAIDLDRMPIRAFSTQNDFIRKLSDDENVQVVDAEKYLYENSENGLIGYNLMIDGHHPNLRGYVLISQLIAKKIQELYPEDTTYTAVSETEAKELFITSMENYYHFYLDVAEWLIRISTWTYNPNSRLNKADEYINLDTDSKKQDAQYFLEKMTISYLKKNTKDAEQYYNNAKRINKSASETFIQSPWVQQVITRASN